MNSPAPSSASSATSVTPSTSPELPHCPPKLLVASKFVLAAYNQFIEDSTPPTTLLTTPTPSPSLAQPLPSEYTGPPSDAECGLPPLKQAALSAVEPHLRPLVSHLHRLPPASVLTGYKREDVAHALGHHFNLERVKTEARARCMLVVTGSDASAKHWVDGLRGSCDEVCVRQLRVAKRARDEVARAFVGMRAPGVVVASQKALSAVREGVSGYMLLQKALRANPFGMKWELVISDVVAAVGLNEESNPFRMVADRQAGRGLIVRCKGDRATAERSLTKLSVTEFLQKHLGKLAEEDRDIARVWATAGDVDGCGKFAADYAFAKEGTILTPAMKDGKSMRTVSRATAVEKECDVETGVRNERILPPSVSDAKIRMDSESRAVERMREIEGRKSGDGILLPALSGGKHIQTDKVRAIEKRRTIERRMKGLREQHYGQRSTKGSSSKARDGTCRDGNISFDGIVGGSSEEGPYIESVKRVDEKLMTKERQGNRNGYGLAVTEEHRKPRTSSHARHDDLKHGKVSYSKISCSDDDEYCTPKSTCKGMHESYLSFPRNTNEGKRFQDKSTEMSRKWPKQYQKTAKLILSGPSSEHQFGSISPVPPNRKPWNKSKLGPKRKRRFSGSEGSKHTSSNPVEMAVRRDHHQDMTQAENTFWKEKTRKVSRQDLFRVQKASSGGLPQFGRDYPPKYSPHGSATKASALRRNTGSARRKSASAVRSEPRLVKSERGAMKPKRRRSTPSHRTSIKPGKPMILKSEASCQPLQEFVPQAKSVRTDTAARVIVISDDDDVEPQVSRKRDSHSVIIISSDEEVSPQRRSVINVSDTDSASECARPATVFEVAVQTLTGGRILSNLSRESKKTYNRLIKDGQAAETRGFFDIALNWYVDAQEIFDGDQNLTSRILALSAIRGKRTASPVLNRQSKGKNARKNWESSAAGVGSNRLDESYGVDRTARHSFLGSGRL